MENCFADNEANLQAQLQLRIRRNLMLQQEYEDKAAAMAHILQFTQAQVR
jgi:hypothetical protein